MSENQQHWDKVYTEKPPTEVSWYEPMPEVSLELLKTCELEKEAAIIDIGGGDSFLAEFLVAQGYKDVTVLDISSKAIERAKERMCEKAEQITWLITDVTEFEPEKQYDLWHDRATFHFLIEELQREQYLKTLKKSVRRGGYLIMGTFSDKGPSKCSGLSVKQYSVGELTKFMGSEFELMSGKNNNHKTPSGAQQNFTFCCFQRKT